MPSLSEARLKKLQLENGEWALQLDEPMTSVSKQKLFKIAKALFDAGAISKDEKFILFRKFEKWERLKKEKEIQERLKA